MDQALFQIFDILNTIKTDLKQQGDTLKSHGEALKSHGEALKSHGEALTSLKNEQNKLGSLVSELRGDFYESTIRTKIQTNKGHSWAKRFYSLSLFDLMKLIPTLREPLDINKTYEKRYSAVEKISKVLLDSKDELIQKYREELISRLKSFNISIISTSSDNLAKELFDIGNHLKGDEEVMQLKSLCIKLAKFLNRPDDLKLFVSCDGVGLQFLILKSCGVLKRDLEFDCRGKVVIIPEKFASVEVGEIKSSSIGVAYARKQVILRCKLLSFIIGTLYPPIEPIMMGYIFYGGHKGQQEDGIDTCGVSIYYENFSSW